MNTQELYEEIKAALQYFDLSFHQMNLMTVAIEGNHIVFAYRGRQIKIPIEA